MNTRWASWRRDLLFALAGMLVASAVLVPVGWWQVCAERERTRAAEAQREALEHQLQERGGEQAEREKAKRAANEQLRLLIQLYELSELKAELRSGPKAAKVEVRERFPKEPR
jgi:hypothetical protein